MSTFISSLSVTCPTCNAGEGRPCRTLEYGHPYQVGCFHESRKNRVRYLSARIEAMQAEEYGSIDDEEA